MGHIRHHAIIVTGTYGDHIEKAHAVAVGLEMSVTPILPATVNATRSFMVGPDGSKEGWDDSDAGDARREHFVAWLNSYRYRDGSAPLAWVEVQYGDDDGETVIIRHSDETLASDDYDGPALAEDVAEATLDEIRRARDESEAAGHTSEGT
jgi:hypothetical protein